MKMIILLWFIISVMTKAEAQDIYACISKGEAEKKREISKKNTVLENVESYQWEFGMANEKDVDRNCPKAMEFLFGKEVGSLLILMDERFFRKDRVEAGDPTLHTDIRKPDIFYAVKNIKKYYKQKSKKGLFTAADQEIFAYVVKVAIAGVDSEETTEFEKVLHDNRRSVERQIACFRQVKLRNIYE